MSIDLPPPSSRLLSQALANLIARRPDSQPDTLAAAIPSALANATPSAAVASSQLDLSAQARQYSATSLSSALTSTATGAVATAAASLPAAGVDAPTQALVNTLLQQFQGSRTPLQASSIQSWPLPLLQQLNAGNPPNPQTQQLAEALPPLQTWLVQQGVLPTRDGPRSFTMSLYVPAAWLSNPANPVASPATPAAVLQLPALPALLAKAATPLPSGVFALILQAGAADHTSALLHVEFGPQQQAAVYGKAMFNPQLDPWQQQAVLQASNARPDLEERQAQRQPLCDSPSCPYAGLSACPQPFCPAMHLVSPITGPAALRD